MWRTDVFTKNNLVILSLCSALLLVAILYVLNTDINSNLTLINKKDGNGKLIEEHNKNAIKTLKEVHNNMNRESYGGYGKIKNTTRDPLIPIIVMAASSNHFLESQGLLQNIDTVLYPKYGAMKIIYFDLGLTRKEREILQRYCRCEVRIFPFEKYSPHVNKSLNACTWKPKIVLEMMKEFHFVMYVDASIRFKKTEKLFDDLLLRTMNPETPVVLIRGYGNIMERTYRYTFESLNEDPWKYNKLPEVGAGWIFARMSKLAVEKIIGPWADCGLKYGCMGKGEIAGHCPTPAKPTVGVCHRFDQSVIGIILNKVYNRDYDKFSFYINQYMDIRRGHRVQYFPKEIQKIS